MVTSEEILKKLLEFHPGLPKTRQFEYVWAINRMHKPVDRIGRVLDLGCNGSILDLYLKMIGWDCWCIDKDPNAAFYATGIRREPSRFIIHDFLEQLPSYLPQFDYVTIISTLEHLKRGEDSTVVRNVKRQLAFKGKILITVPYGDGYNMQGQWRVKCYNSQLMRELVEHYTIDLRVESWTISPHIGDLPLFCVVVGW